MAGADPILPSDKGIGSYIHNSLYLNFQILSVIVMTVIVGLSAILPCAIVIWIGVKRYAFRPGPAVPASRRCRHSCQAPSGLPKATNRPTAIRRRNHNGICFSMGASFVHEALLGGERRQCATALFARGRGLI